MNLKKCTDCGQDYSLRAPACIHCGAPNDDMQSVATKSESSSFLGWIGAAICVAIGFYSVNPSGFIDIIRFFKPDVNVIAESDIRSCSSNGAQAQMRSAFDQSQYALANSLKVISIETQKVATEDGSALSCHSQLMLNNSEKVNFIFNFTQKDDQYLITGRPL
ncbi:MULTISPECIES: hypothetical protein [Acinetobacter]|uniref:Zinc ribbon domain-containing protein n=1 Tax=Acinetobacter piscicola TaxID=2006115 RepID=A0A7S7AJ65_9GAMM|nr:MULTISPECIES: hypothetical protein [Acinetobacter]QOW47446.1 hypothetical protein G0028_17025 [Acinetobacter piscicola]